MEKIRPRLGLIAATARNNVIGQGNRLPWHLPADLAHFKKMTMGKPMIMGRNTWESLPGLLPGRRHIVVTSNPAYVAEGGEIATSLESAIEKAGGVDEVMIVGGAMIYQQALELVDQMFLTKIDLDVEGDAFFPSYDPTEWTLLSKDCHVADEKNAYDYCFEHLVRA